MDFEIGLDWLSMSFPAENLVSVVDLLTPIFGDGYEDRGALGYTHSLRFSEGAVALFYSRTDDGFTRPEAFLDLKGSAFGLVESDALAWLLTQLWGLGVKCTRIDARVDDFEKIISAKEIEERYVKTGLFGGFKVAMGVQNYSSGAVGGGVSFGRRGKAGCGKYFVIYDKSVESGGAVDAVRYEASFAKERAHEALKFLMGYAGPFGDHEELTSENMRARLGELIGGAIEFYASAGDHHAARRQPAPFWETIRGWLRQGKDSRAG